MMTLAIIGWISLIVVGLILTVSATFFFFATSAIGDGLSAGEVVFGLLIGVVLLLYWEWVFSISPFVVTVTKATGG